MNPVLKLDVVSVPGSKFAGVNAPIASLSRVIVPACICSFVILFGAILLPSIDPSWILSVVTALSAIFIFVYKGEFAVYTNLFVVFYSIFGVTLGILYFQEALSLAQWIGIAFALVGVVLINSK